MPAAACEVVDTRRLDRYPLEQILTLDHHTPLLLLVRVLDDSTMFSGRGGLVRALQNLPTKMINGFEYYQLKCTLSDVTTHKLVTCGAYSEDKFKNEFKFGKAGFQVQFVETDKKAAFTWKEIISSPLTFMFFGPPLTKSRSFDHIFHEVKSMNTLHARLLAYYNETVGDLNACLFLKSAYLHGEIKIMAKH